MTKSSTLDKHNTAYPILESLKSKVLKNYNFNKKESKDKTKEKEIVDKKINFQNECISCKVYNDKLKKINDECNEKDIIIAKTNQIIMKLEKEIKSYKHEISTLNSDLNEKNMLIDELNRENQDLKDNNYNNNTENKENHIVIDDYKSDLKRENDELKLEISNLSNQLGEQKLLEEMLKNQIYKFKEYLIENC
jgi:hypothetical protein